MELQRKPVWGGLVSMATACALGAALTFPAKAAKVEVPLIADTLLAGHSAEYQLNCGGRGALRVKGFQGIVVFRFDMSALKGKRVSGGVLTAYCVSITGEAAGASFSEGVSTISHDWLEGVGDYVLDLDAASYAWPGDPIDDEWDAGNEEPSDRYGPNDAMDVVGGFGGSIVNTEGNWEFNVGEWTEITLDEELVQGLVDGDQYGIAILRNSVGVNLDLASKEHQGGSFTATLEVESTGLDVEPQDKLASSWGKLKVAR